MEMGDQQEIQAQEIHSANMTLNRLNAHELEIDVESDNGMPGDVKLEFVANHEEVTS